MEDRNAVAESFMPKNLSFKFPDIKLRQQIQSILESLKDPKVSLDEILSSYEKFFSENPDYLLTLFEQF